jgi:hypothetical protein
LFAELGTTQIKNHFHEKSTLPDKGPVGPLSPMETFTPLRKTMTAHKLKGLIWPECIMNISFGLKDHSGAIYKRKLKAQQLGGEDLDA